MAKPANPIPPGFHSLTVHLAVNGAAAYIDFLTRAFNAVEISRSPGPDGKLMHVQMRIGDSMIMFNDIFGPAGAPPAPTKGQAPVYLNLYVVDADAAFNQAVAAGCEVTMPLADQFWGNRYGHVRDPFGFNWAITSRTEELTPEELQERAAKAFSRGKP